MVAGRPWICLGSMNKIEAQEPKIGLLSPHSRWEIWYCITVERIQHELEGWSEEKVVDWASKNLAAATFQPRRETRFPEETATSSTNIATMSLKT